MNRIKPIISWFLNKEQMIPAAGILVMITLTILCSNIPFFWDTSFFANGAAYFNSNGIGHLVLPLNADSGGFPLYSLWIALGWALFGKTLVISHFIILPFIIGIVYAYCRLAKKFLDNSMLKWAMLLLLLEPTFMTQSILMSYDLMLLFFFLLSLNALLDGRKVLYAVALILLVLSSVRGIISLAALALIHVVLIYEFKERPFKRYGAFLYIPAILASAGWAVWHYIQSGWFVFSPEREANHESLVGISMMFRQCIYILWKTADFGRIILFLIVASGIVLAVKKKSFTQEFKKLLCIICIPLLMCIIVMSPLANPVGHKYFLITIVMLPVVVLYSLKAFERKWVRNILVGISALALVTGNFWIYPERYGNGWDGSLKVIPWFNTEKQVYKYIHDNQIPFDQTGTLWPIYSDPGISLPGDPVIGYADLTGKKVSSFPYVLQSNICNYFSPEALHELQNRWITIERWQCGQVYAVLYKNPLTVKQIQP